MRQLCSISVHFPDRTLQQIGNKILLKCVPIYCIVSIPQKGKRFIPHAKSSDQLSEPINLLFSGYQGFFVGDKRSFLKLMADRTCFTARHFVQHSHIIAFTFHTSTYRSEFEISWNISFTLSICVHRAGTTSLNKKEWKYAYEVL